MQFAPVRDIICVVQNIQKNEVVKMSRLEPMSLSENESPECQEMQKQHLARPTEEPFTPLLEENPLKESDEEEVFQDSKGSQEQDIESSQEEEGVSAGEGDSSRQRDGSHRQHFEKFLNDLSKFDNPDAKLQFTIDFMESSLAQTGTPHFKSFWEARSTCLQLFKENITPPLRATLWAKYNELSKEARRLKEILDEQSAFAVEQIEMAIKALENDIASFDEHLQRIASVEFSATSKVMIKRLPHYQKLQNELNLLNTQASRINALRKELIRTEMRVRQKNKFFQRLSLAGDKVFPRRKELIKDVSNSFISDVDTFIKENFSESESQHDSLFSLREEIKALQNMAKVLTLNTHSFTHTRMRLSDCWDRIKSEEKERKKERAQQKAIYKQNVDEAMLKLQAFNQSFQANQPSVSEANKQLDEIFAFMRGLELGRDEQRFLREELNAARKPLIEKQQAADNQRHHQENERERIRRESIQEVKQQIEDLLKNNESLDVDAVTAKRETIIKKIDSISLSKAEKLEIERQLKPLRDLISEKKESSLLALSDDDRQSLQQLKEILKQRKDRRQEIKTQIETLRKSSGSSGLDFEQAMNYNAQLAAEKERLEKIVQGIKEIEQKISNLEKR